MRASCCDVFLFLLFEHGVVSADDWPQWRGPHRDADWQETGIVDSIPAGGLTVAAGSSGWTVRLWDVVTQQQSTVLNDHRGAVNAVALSSDGRLLATGSSDETIKLWNMKTHTAIDILRGHASGVTTIAFSPYNGQLFSGAMEGPVRVWTLPSHRPKIE